MDAHARKKNLERARDARVQEVAIDMLIKINPCAFKLPVGVRREEEKGEDKNTATLDPGRTNGTRPRRI